MGNRNTTESQITEEEINETEILKQRLEREGPEAIVQYVRENLDRWRLEEVYIGVAGRTFTGKSTFINAILGLRANQTGAAKVGSGNTTDTVTPYQNPRNPKMIVYDFPGVGTPEFPRHAYMSHVIRSKCQYFLIFFDSVISEDDIWFAEHLKANNLPFCFVRSKIDVNIESAHFDGKTEEEVMIEVRQKANCTISLNEHIARSPIFFISGRHTNVGEFPRLLTHMEENFPPIKFEAIVFSISSTTIDVLERKYRQLKRRIRLVSLGAAAVSAQPLPGIDVAINIGIMVHEVLHYVHTLGLGEENLANIPGNITHNLTVRNLLFGGDNPVQHFIMTSLGKMITLMAIESVFDFFVPYIGSLISAPTTFVIVYRFLNNILDKIRDDAIVIYRYALQTETSF